jgi:hypothetical protein
MASVLLRRPPTCTGRTRRRARFVSSGGDSGHWPRTPAIRGANHAARDDAAGVFRSHTNVRGHPKTNSVIWN